MAQAKDANLIASFYKPPEATESDRFDVEARLRKKLKTGVEPRTEEVRVLPENLSGS
jgi:hypothetical protein